MDYKELDSLITFRMGLPSIYHIMLGMSMYQTEEYAKELDRKETDNYDLNAFLKNMVLKSKGLVSQETPICNLTKSQL